MKTGDIVRVFNKPITDEGQEGIAKLIKHFPEGDDSEIGQLWSVCFVGKRGELEAQSVDRMINARNLVRS